MYVNRRRPQHFNYGKSGQIRQESSFNQILNNGIARNYSHPYQQTVPAPIFHNPDWQTYQAQNPYYPGQYQPFNHAYQPYPQQNSHQVQHPIPKDSQFLFQNPLQPQEEIYPYQKPQPQMNGFINPYPKNNLMMKQPGGMHSLINSFKSQDGSVDFNKMMNTAGQMMNAVTQVTSLVKGLGGIFKV